jgi:serine/threonine protein kinase
MAYMSPEQARGQDLDARTDLFSFGAVLYEMVTGSLAFNGETSGEILEAIFCRDPAALIPRDLHVPAELERIIKKALEKDKTLRYQSASDMGADLQRLRRDMTWATSLPRAGIDSTASRSGAESGPASARRPGAGSGRGIVDWPWIESPGCGSAAPSIAVLPMVDLSPGRTRNTSPTG